MTLDLDLILTTVMVIFSEMQQPLLKRFYPSSFILDKSNSSTIKPEQASGTSHKKVIGLKEKWLKDY